AFRVTYRDFGHFVTFSRAGDPTSSFGEDRPDELIDVVVMASETQSSILPPDPNLTPPLHEVARMLLHLPGGGGTTSASVTWPAELAFPQLSWTLISVLALPHGLTLQQAIDARWSISSDSYPNPVVGTCPGGQR